MVDLGDTRRIEERPVLVVVGCHMDVKRFSRGISAILYTTEIHRRLHKLIGIWWVYLWISCPWYGAQNCGGKFVRDLWPHSKISRWFNIKASWWMQWWLVLVLCYSVLLLRFLSACLSPLYLHCPSLLLLKVGCHGSTLPGTEWLFCIINNLIVVIITALNHGSHHGYWRLYLSRLRLCLLHCLLSHHLNVFDTFLVKIKLFKLIVSGCLSNRGLLREL